jgi:hypothetical protein
LVVGGSKIKIRIKIRIGRGEKGDGEGEEPDDGTKGTGGAETRNPKQVRIGEGGEKRGEEGKIMGAKSWGGSGLVD